MDYKADAVRPDELELLARDVRYEFDMVRGCASALLAMFGTRADQGLLRNVFAESLNIHARSLVDFFSTTLSGKRSVRGDDVVAQHFVPLWDPERDGHVDLIYLESALIQSVHKRIAHLTAYRVRVPKDDDALPVVEIHWAVVGLMEGFFAALTPERKAWFESDLGPLDFSPLV